MSRKTGTKWKTKNCGRCGEAHNGYSGKLDQNDIEYVVCGIMNKRMNVSGMGMEAHSIAFTTMWEMDKIKREN
jgi:hypothetical protein